ncbi:MAG TPA: exodeoxyribonuclease VII small subunit [Firmicutes bacterium]|nr:exodeoxyribonuclease VII small subunit [Bacillota bacterium]
MAEEWTFEKAMTRLEQIVAMLESGKCSLDDSLKLFEEGTRLTAYCTGALKTAEQKIIKLTAADVAAAKEAAASGGREAEPAPPDRPEQGA